MIPMVPWIKFKHALEGASLRRAMRNPLVLYDETGAVYSMFLLTFNVSRHIRPGRKTWIPPFHRWTLSTRSAVTDVDRVDKIVSYKRLDRAIGVNRVNWRRYSYLSNSRRIDDRSPLSERTWRAYMARFMTRLAFSWNDAFRRPTMSINVQTTISNREHAV